MPDSSWNYNHVAKARFHGCALRAAKPKCCRTTENAERFVRRAVVMGKRINAGPPRTGPVVFGEALFYDRSKVFRVWTERFAVEQQRKGVVGNRAVVFKD